jgi:hypothetical protein
VLGRNTRTTVSHDTLEMVATQRRRQQHGATGGRELDRIAYDVAQSLLNALRIASDDRDPIMDLVVEIDPFRERQTAGVFADALE